MPTVNELLKRLPEIIAEMVSENMDEDQRDSDFKHCAELIVKGFSWEDSPERDLFWYFIYRDCIANKI